MDNFERRVQDAHADYTSVFESTLASIRSPQRRAGESHSEANRRDAEIALSARNLLRSDKYLLEGNIPNVAVSDGWVTLWGEVMRSYKRQPATRAVFRLPGVSGVCDQISVTPREDVASEQ